MSVASHESPIDVAAGDWFARRQSGEWTPELQERLDRWFGESPLHRVAYLRIEQVWERAERLKVLATGRERVSPPGSWAESPFFGSRSSRGKERSQRSGRWIPAALVASVALLACMAGSWMLWSSRGSVYRTPVGGLERISLADDSTVTLNTDSAVRVQLTEHERRVKLERGEAFFEVAKDPLRPFIVEADGRRVVAVGTQFSVRREDQGGDIQLVVTEGAVRMEGSVGSARTEVVKASAPNGVLLGAGTVAHVSGVNVLVQKVPTQAAQEALSWRQGVLVFHDLTLAQAAAEFNRYNSRQIVIADAAVGGLTIAGSFRANNLEAFVRLLEKAYPVKARLDGDQLFLGSR